MPRGTIVTPKRFKQRCRFDGMVWGTISPTDVDAAIDFNDRLFVFIEAKSGSSPLGTGQRLFLERLCRKEHPRQAVALVARHDTPADEDIILAECAVESVYSHKRWNPVDVRISVMDQIGILLDEHGLDYGVTRRVASTLPKAAVRTSCMHLERYKENGRCWICERT